jgi:hypothetical protein
MPDPLPAGAFKMISTTATFDEPHDRKFRGLLDATAKLAAHRDNS